MCLQSTQTTVETLLTNIYHHEISPVDYLHEDNYFLYNKFPDVSRMEI